MMNKQVTEHVDFNIHFKENHVCTMELLIMMVKILWTTATRVGVSMGMLDVQEWLVVSSV